MVALSLFMPAAVAAALASLLSVRRGPAWVDALWRASVCGGLAVGASSLTFFLWLFAFGSAGAGYVCAEAVICIASLGVCFSNRRSGHNGPPVIETDGSVSLQAGVVKRLPIVFAVAAALAVAAFVMKSLDHPHGYYDAWGMWNMRARFLFRGGDHWMRAFSEHLPSPDYPLLLPAVVARMWWYGGIDAPYVPAAVGAFYTFATVGVVFATVARLRGVTQASIAGLVMLGTPRFLVVGSWQYADVPVAFYFVACASLLYADRPGDGARTPALVLAGLAAGLAAWTKNEGLLVVGAVLVSHFGAGVNCDGWKRAARHTGLVLAGLTPALMVVALFKLALAGSNAWLSADAGSIAERTLDGTRWALIFGEALARLRSVGVIFLVVHALIVGFAVSLHQRKALAALVSMLVLMAVAYALVYLTTPFALAWQLHMSARRLILQPWPVLIVTYFLAVRQAGTEG